MVETSTIQTALTRYSPPEKNPAMSSHASATGPHSSGPGSGKVYRGSRKRLNRIKWQENTSLELWIFVVVVLFILFVAVPWIIEHPPSDQDHVTTMK